MRNEWLQVRVLLAGEQLTGEVVTSAIAD
jgi:hypothetical protein